MFKILCLFVNMNRSLTLMILNLLFTLHHKSMKMSIKSSNHNWIKIVKKDVKLKKKGGGLQNEVHYKDFKFVQIYVKTYV
jgi:hypothetical protein